MSFNKILVLILSMVLVVSVSACKQEIKVEPETSDSVSVETYEEAVLNKEVKDISDVENGKTYQSIKYTVISCENNQALKESLDELNASMKKEAENFKTKNKDGIRDFIKENPDMQEAEYSHTSDITFIRSDSRYLSFIEFVYVNMMGAHGMYYQNGHTYDVRTGKKLGLEDFVKDKEELREFLKSWIKEHDNEYGFFDEAPGTIDAYINGEYHLEFYINEDLTVMFQPYDLAPYAAGLIEIKLDKSLLKVNLSDI